MTISIFVVANTVKIIIRYPTNFQQLILNLYVNFSYSHSYKIYISSGQGVKLNSNMTSFIGYMNNAVIKILIYFTSHMHIVVLIVFIQVSGA